MKLGKYERRPFIDLVRNQYYPSDNRQTHNHNVKSTGNNQSKRKIHSLPYYINYSNIKDSNHKYMINPKQTIIFKKENERLQSQNLKKQKLIVKLKSQNLLTKQIKEQNKELYRIINYYQGKISELQLQVKKYFSEQFIKDQNKNINFIYQQLIEKLRTDNIELKGNYELKKYQIDTLQQKLHKYQSKYFNTTWKLSSTKRNLKKSIQSNSSKNQKNAISLTLQGSKPHKQNEQDLKYQQLNRRILIIERQIEQLQTQNNKLQKQLQECQRLLSLQKKKNEEKKYKGEYKSKQILKNGDQDHSDSERDNAFSTYNFQQSKEKNFTRSTSKTQIFTLNQKLCILSVSDIRKIKFILMRTSISYNSFIQTLVNNEGYINHILSGIPYKFQEDLILKIEKQLRQIKLLSQNEMQKYHDNIRKKFMIHLKKYQNIQKNSGVSNHAKNQAKKALSIFIEELNYLTKKYGNTISSQFFQQSVKQWGMRDSDIDYICLIAFEHGMGDKILINEIFQIFDVKQF